MAVRRNLIIVLGHGLRSDALGDARAWPLATPNFEKLAQRGLRMVATSACTSDDGGLISLLTGLHVRQHGYWDSQRGLTCAGWPAELSTAGIHLVGVGRIGAVQKWLNQAILVEDPEVLESPRCSYLAAMRDKGILPALQLQRRQRLRSGPFEPDRLILEPDDDIDGYIGLQAYRQLEQMPADRPWALLVAFTGPANDLPPPSLYDQVADSRALADGFIPADFRRLDALCELDYPRVMLQRLEPASIARIRGDYLGRVSLLDYALGRLTSQLGQRADRDRTWLIIAADRGQLLGEHGLVGHRSFLSGAIETPMIIVPPMPTKAAVVEGLVSTVDVAATILDLGGCDMPSVVAGRSLLPLFKGGSFSSPHHDTCLCESGRRLMLETKRHKVVFDTDSLRAIGLFDLLNDPGEQQNLVDSTVGRNLLDSLRWRLGDALLPLRAWPGGGI